MNIYEASYELLLVFKMICEYSFINETMKSRQIFKDAILLMVAK